MSKTFQVHVVVELAVVVVVSIDDTEVVDVDELTSKS